MTILSAGAVHAREIARFTQPLDVRKADGVQTREGQLVLYDKATVQPDDKNTPIVIEAEDYAHALWQKADTDTAVSERWIADVLARGKENRVEDKSASGGLAVQRAETLVYPIYFKRRQAYDVYIRFRRPRVRWCWFQVDEGRRVPRGLKDKRWRTKKKEIADDDWFWVHLYWYGFGPGVEMFYIHNCLSGTLVDKIVFDPRRGNKPEGLGPGPSPMGRPPAGTVTFDPLEPDAVQLWKSVDVPRIREGGVVTAEVSWDGGKTFAPVGDNGRLDPPRRTAPSMQLRLTLGLDKRGRAPAVALPSVTYVVDRAAWPALESDNARYTFNAATGCLSGVEVKGLRDISVVAPGTLRKPFRLWMKEVTPGEVGIEVETKRKNKRKNPPKPKREDRWIDSDLFRLVSKDVGAKRVAFTFRHKTLPIAVTTRYTLNDAGYLDCESTIENDSRFDVLGIECPRLTQIRIGDEAADDELAWPVGTGRITPRTAMSNVDIGYPKAAVGYFDYCDPEAGLYMGFHDPELIAGRMSAGLDKRLVWAEGALQKRDLVPAGGGRKTFRTVVGAHRGDWHSGADWYRAWFEATFPAADWPEWLAESDGWLFGNLTFNVRHFDDLRDHLFREAIRLGLRHVQIWGTSYTGGGGQYYTPAPPYGGHERFAAANKWWKDRGGIVGYYMFPNGINYWVMWPEHDTYFGVPWEEIPAWGRPPGWHADDDKDKRLEWLRRNAWYDDELKAPPLDKWKGFDGWRGNKAPHPESIWMCPLAEEWNDWYKFWVVDKFVGDFHTGASYNDTFHLGGSDFAANPVLGIRDRGVVGQRRHAFAREIRDEARALNPMYLPVMEMQCDAYGMYMAYMIGASAIDTEMLYYTHPTHKAFEGQTGSGQFGFERFKRVGSAWLYGSLLDMMTVEDWYVEVLQMRHWITRWVNDSRFLDDLGLTVKTPHVEGKLRRLMTDDGSRGFLVTFWHRRRHDYHPENYTLRGHTWPAIKAEVDLGPMAEVDDTGTRAEDWIPKRAYLLDFGHGIEPLDFEIDRGGPRPVIRFEVPSRWVGGVLFVREAKGEHGFLTHVDQREFERLEVQVLNPGNAPIEGTVRMRSEKVAFETDSKPFEIDAGKRVTLTFPYADGPPTMTELVEVDVTAAGVTRTIRAGAYPFMDDASFEVYPEDRVAPRVKDGFDGEYSLKMRRFGFRSEPNTRYRLRMMMKAPEAAQRVRLEFNDIWRTSKKLDGVRLKFDHDVQVTGEWTPVEITFRTPVLNYDTSVGMRRSEGPILVDAVRLEKLPDDAKVQYEPRFVEFPEGHERHVP